MKNENNQTEEKQEEDTIIVRGVVYIREQMNAYLEELSKPIPETPKTPAPKGLEIKSASFLSDNDLGREIHNAVIQKYSDIEGITKIKIGQGSNPFYVVAVNEYLRVKHPKIRTATQADLERILRENINLELKGHYEDSGLTLRTRQDPNKYLAGDLFNQFKAQGKPLKENSAYVLWLHNLSLRKDQNSPNKISFVIPNGFTDYFEAQILNEISQKKFEYSDIEHKTGIPIKVSDSGSRTLYTRNWKDYSVKNSGLVRVYLNWSLVLNSYDEDLAYSDDVGRVVLVSAEGDAF